jgi:uncharacterized cupredoxin-like copper-binding protein
MKGVCVRLSRLAGVVPVVLLVAACSSGGGATQASSAASPTAAPSAATRIEVALTDAFRIEPAAMTVPAGAAVTFVVTNHGVIDHEFYLGDETAQAAHEAEMVTMGGMTHDEPEGIGVKPGETRELTYTFAEAASSLAGCHVVGHYLAGMRAEIAVRP